MTVQGEARGPGPAVRTDTEHVLGTVAGGQCPAEALAFGDGCLQRPAVEHGCSGSGAGGGPARSWDARLRTSAWYTLQVALG
ncbi:hypothetical protein, partial [Streptomyces xanthochromogenes]